MGGPEREPRHYALAVWLVGAAAVAVWDIARPDDTLTSSFRRGLESPYAGPLLALGVGATALHLLGLVDREHDAFYVIPGFIQEQLDNLHTE